MVRVFEAFSGYGSQSLALERLGIPYEVVAISEIDKYAIQAYEALHGKVLNLGDISKIKVDDVPDHDLFTYSFPCQDISVAGKQAGIAEGTRSGLLWECERIIEGKKPKYLLMENVKNLVGKKHKPDFYKWCDWLSSRGYTNYWQVLNAKDYGVPQNRERVFMISILGEHKPYVFPNGGDSGIRLKDILEDEVDEKYYVSQEKVQQLIKNLNGKVEFDKHCIGTCHPRNDLSFATRDRVYSAVTESPTLTATQYKDPVEVAIPLEKNQDKHGVVQVGNIVSTGNWNNPQRGRIYSSEGCSPALNTVGGGGLEPKVVVPAQQECAKHTHDFRIRKLTPRECFRVMGLRDDEIDQIQATGVSNSQQYKMAGNSIVVDVLEHIFKNLFAE